MRTTLLENFSQDAQRLYRVYRIEVEGVVAKHSIEKTAALVMVKTYLAQVAHIALQHIVQQTGILWRESHTWKEGMGAR